MLGVRPVGIHDNFFDLGGHSLLAVQLLSRIQEQMGVELSLDVVYAADFTVAELAKSIELREIELAGAGDYARLLAEVEAMTDDEVRALLAAEGPMPGGEAS
jgi:acyl carrier protein